MTTRICDTYEVPILQYGYNQRRGPDMTLIYLLGGLVAFFLLTAPKKTIEPIVSGAQALRAMIVSKEDKHEVKTIMETDDVHKTAKKVKEHMEKHPKCLLMFVATWCPHCHTTMDALKKDPSALEGLEILIVNYMCMPKSAFDPNSLDKVCELTHFPAIFAVVDGEPLAAASVPEAVAKTKKGEVVRAFRTETERPEEAEWPAEAAAEWPAKEQYVESPQIESPQIESPQIESPSYEDDSSAFANLF